MCELMGGIGGADLLGMGLDGISAGAKIAGGRKQAEASRAAARYRSQLATRKAEVAEILAKDEKVLAIKEANILQQKGRQLKSKQRVAAAASGIQANFGSPVDVLVSTENVLAIEEATIKDNAERKAFSHRVSAADLLSEASYQRSTENNFDTDTSDALSLLTTAGKTALKFI